MRRNRLFSIFFRALAVAVCVTMLPFAAMRAEDTVRVIALKGPTGIGMAHMIAQNDGTYQFELAGAPEDIVGKVAQGLVDIAAVPTNLAATLYQKTQGGVQLLALNTLGVLYVLERGDTIQSVADLSGKTILVAGQGSTPEYVLNYLLDKNGVTDATVEFKSEHSEVTSLAAAGKADVVLVPEPHVTSLLATDTGFRIALDVTEAFAGAAALDGRAGTVLSMGCVIVNAAFAKEHPERVQKYMEDCAASVAFANTNVAEAAQEVEDAGIMPKAAVAQKAIPNCNLVFITGEAMKEQVAPLFDILYAANPASVGGALPDDAFYYLP